MKKCIYFISALFFFLLVSLLAAQIFLSPFIERKIEEEIKKEFNSLGVEFSVSECSVDLLRRNVILDRLKFQWHGNDFKISRIEVSFSFLELLLRRAICLIEVEDGDINITNWMIPIPYLEEEKVAIDVVPVKPAEPGFFIRKLRINNLFVGIEVEDDIEIPDFSLKVLLEDIGVNKKANFFIETIQTPFWIELKGNVELPDWKEHFVFNVKGEGISLKTFALLQDKFLPEDTPVRLIDGKASFAFEGEVNNGIIQSLARISISEISVVMAEGNLLREVLPEPLHKALLKPFLDILPEPFYEILPESFLEDLSGHFLYGVSLEPLEKALLDGFTANQTIEITLEIEGSLTDLIVEHSVSLVLIETKAQ